MRLKPIKDSEGGIAHHTFSCPGCKEVHVVRNDWNFNGDLERPTIRPALVYRPPGVTKDIFYCHIIITDGIAHFTEDCHHELAGKEAPLPSANDGERLFADWLKANRALGDSLAPEVRGFECKDVWAKVGSGLSQLIEVSKHQSGHYQFRFVGKPKRRPQ